MIQAPPNPEERAKVEAIFERQYPTGDTWPLTTDSAKRGILAAIRRYEQARREADEIDPSDLEAAAEMFDAMF